MTSSSGRSVDEPNPKGQPLRRDLAHRAGDGDPGSSDAALYSGGCHCAAIRFRFETRGPLAPRACQCSFCRKHGARSVSDPEGTAILTLGPKTLRYRFASKAADYILCARCGIYVGAVAELDGRTLVTLNLNACDDPRLDLEATPVWYDGETAAAKAERRRLRWTPARLA